MNLQLNVRDVILVFMSNQVNVMNITCVINLKNVLCHTRAPHVDFT